MANQNNYWIVFLITTLLGIMGMLIIFFDLFRNSGMAFIILSAVLALTGFLTGAKITKTTLYILISTLLGLIIASYHIITGSIEAAVLFMIIVFSTGFILVIVPGKKKQTKAQEIRHIIKREAAQKEDLPTIQVINEETDKIYKELEKIEDELKKIEVEEAKKKAAKKKPRKKAKKKKPKKRRKKKKTAKKKKAS